MPRRKVTTPTLTQSITIRTLHQISGLRVCDIIGRRYPAFNSLSSATVYRHAKKPLPETNTPRDGRFGNKSSGRKSKLTKHDIRQMKRGVAVIRQQCVTFTSTQLQEHCGIHNVSNGTFRRALRTLG